MNRFISYSLCLIWIAAVMTGCSGSKDYKSASELDDQFKTFFGFAPTSDVTELKASKVWVGDSMADWISFRCRFRTHSSGLFKVINMRLLKESRLHDTRGNAKMPDVYNP